MAGVGRAVSQRAQAVPMLALRALGSPTDVAVEHGPAVLVAATVADLTADHHEVDRRLVWPVHVEVDLAG